MTTLLMINKSFRNIESSNAAYYGVDFMITWYLRLKFITKVELEHHWASTDEQVGKARWMKCYNRKNIYVFRIIKLLEYMYNYLLYCLLILSLYINRIGNLILFFLIIILNHHWKWMIEYSIYLNFLYIRNFHQYLIKFVLSLLERNTS